MARKTKSEKIIAELRRKIKATEGKSFVVSKQGKEPAHLYGERQPSVIEKVSQISFSQSVDLIKRDIFKTFYLSLFIIGLELFLYWSFELSGKKLLDNFLSKKIF